MNTKIRTVTQNLNVFSEQIHLSDYLNILKKRKKVIIIFSAVLIGIVTTFSFLSTPVYKATSQIIIERQMYPVTRAEEVENTDIKENGFYQTQYNLLISRSLALKVIKDLQLWKEFPSNNSLKPEYLIKDSQSTINPQSQPNKLSTKSIVNGDTTSSSDWSDIIDWYLGNLKIEPVRDSRLINISFLSTSQNTAARVANAHARAFIEKSAQLKLSASQQGLSWLKTQLQEQKLKLEATQRVVHDYKKAQDVVSFEDRQNIVSQKLMDLNTSLTKVKSDRMAKQELYNQLNAFSINNENIFSLPEVAQNSVILNLRNQLSLLKAQRSEMVTNFGHRHPKMIDLNSRIKQLEDEISSEVQLLSRAIKAELDRALAYERSIQQTLNGQKDEALTVNEKAINYDLLRQEAQSNQQIYDTLLNRAKELGLASAFENSNISIVDEAEVPQIPVKPRTSLNILLAIVMSMFMGPFLAFFFEYMDNTVKTPEDIQHKLGMPALGIIPFYNLKNGKRNTALFWDNSVKKKGEYAKTYYGSDIANPLIHSIQVILQKKPGQVVFIQSAESGEGKTTVLANAGLRLSKNGFKVLMVDADFKHPSLHQMFGIENKDGLVNAINQILSQSIDAGTLDTCSVDDLFTIISLKKLSGNLAVTNNSNAISAFFENGRLYHLESRENPFANRLGTMLVSGGFITNTQLEDALERNQRTGLPLGYILINSGYLTHDKLRGPLKLQMEGQLQKLFSWKHGTFSFEQKNLETYENERIHFKENYTTTIQHLSHTGGSRLFEGEILSHIKTLTNPDVSLLTSGTESPKVSGMLFVMLLSKFIDILKQRFDIVLVDTPPLLEDPDATLLSSISDGVILVVKAGNLSVKAIREASTGIKEVNAKVLGAVLNHVKP